MKGGGLGTLGGKLSAEPWWGLGAKVRGAALQNEKTETNIVVSNPLSDIPAILATHASTRRNHRSGQCLDCRRLMEVRVQSLEQMH